MRGFQEYHNSLFSTIPCDAQKGNFLPFVHPFEAKKIAVSCYNPLRKNIVTCQDLYKEEFIAEVGGLELNSRLSTEITKVPPYIPVLDLRSASVGNLPSTCSIVAVTLWDILQRCIFLRAGRYHEVGSISFRTDILAKRNFKSKKVILFLTGSDTLIEWIWYNREQCRLFETIKKMGVWAVGGFNFSLIEGECPFSHALNLKRSLFSVWLAEQAGLPVIPHVYCLNDYHIRRWVEWFRANTSIKLFTINCQLQKSEEDIRQIITTVEEILTALPYLHVLLQGFHLNKINRFGHFLPRIHFADKIAAKYAQSHRQIFFDSKHSKLDDEYKEGLNLNELLEPNINNRYLFIERIKNSLLN